jgi:hypothetical protein
VYGALHTDAAKAGFDDQFIYTELDKTREERHIPMLQLLHQEADAVFQEWEAIENRKHY